MNILILNGPNLNLLSQREPETYGRWSMGQLEEMCRAKAERLGVSVDFLQSNRESDLIDWIQSAPRAHQGIIINAGALSHTSIAILDALKAVRLPVIEVHLSNVFQRESFRHHSYVSLASVGMICGLGVDSYLLAVEGMSRLLKEDDVSDR